MTPVPSAARYRVYGLSMRADRPIDGLAPETPHGDVQLEILWTAPPATIADEETNHPGYSSPFTTSRGTPVARAWGLEDGAYLRLLMSDGASFTVDRRGTRVWVEPGTVDRFQISAYLLGPILGLALRRRGLLCLHASVIAIDGRAVAFAGPEGAGKSTIAALCVMRGATALTDDLASVAEDDGAFWIRPGAPYLRMRRGAVEVLAAERGRRSDLVPSSDSRYLDLKTTRGSSPPARGCELAAIYVLDSTMSSGGAPAAIVRMTGASGLIAIVGDTWATRLLDRDERAAELDVVARMVERVPLWRVALPVDPSDFRELADRAMGVATRV